MRYQAFGNKQAAVIGFGTADFGGTIPEALGHELLDAYTAIGGNFIDTARVYGDFAKMECGGSEKVIGTWLEKQSNRERYFISTKGAHPRLDTMTVGRLSRAEIFDDIHESLEALRTDHVDIYWLHRDDISRPVGEIMETLNALLEAKETNLIGVSNWTPKRILEANAYAEAHGLVKLYANQPRYSLADQKLVEDPTLCAMDAETWAMHKATGMTLVCFSSIAKGFFTQLDKVGAEGLSDKAKRRFYYPDNLAIYERLKVLRAETGYSIHSLALAYLTCQDVPTFPLVSSRKPEHVAQLNEAADTIITPAQRDYLFHY